MSLRPEVNAAWRNLIRAIRSNMTTRRYELVTMAAAKALRSAYCLLAHGAVLRSQIFGAEQVEAIVRDYRDAGLEPAEVEMMAFAEKVTLRAHEVTAEDVQKLRDNGFSDADILDITFATTARSFFSKTLAALGAEPDAAFDSLEPALRQALALGRPVGEE